MKIKPNIEEILVLSDDFGHTHLEGTYKVIEVHDLKLRWDMVRDGEISTCWIRISKEGAIPACIYDVPIIDSGTIREGENGEIKKWYQGYVYEISAESGNGLEFEEVFGLRSSLSKSVLIANPWPG